MELRELAVEFVRSQYNGPLVEDRSVWPDRLANAAGAIKGTAEIVGVAATEADGFQVIAVESYDQENSYLVCEMSELGAEINLWVRYGKDDWENYGPKEEGFWD